MCAVLYFSLGLEERVFVSNRQSLRKVLRDRKSGTKIAGSVQCTNANCKMSQTYSNKKDPSYCQSKAAVGLDLEKTSSNLTSFMESPGTLQS